MSTLGDLAGNAYYAVRNLSNKVDMVCEKLRNASALDTKWRCYRVERIDYFLQFDDWDISGLGSGYFGDKSWMRELFTELESARNAWQKYADLAGPKEKWPEQMQGTNSRLLRCEWFFSFFGDEAALVKQSMSLSQIAQQLSMCELNEARTGVPNPRKKDDIIKNLDKQRALCGYYVDRVDQALEIAEKNLLSKHDLGRAKELSSARLFREINEEVARKYGLPSKVPEYIEPTVHNSGAVDHGSNGFFKRKPRPAGALSGEIWMWVVLLIFLIPVLFVVFVVADIFAG